MARHDDYDRFGWAPYVSVAQRRQQATREVEKLKKKGQTISPVKIEGRTIATTFWGKAWCNNLESYSDYSNRLPRGRTYVRNGSVVDLQIAPGVVHALVSGSSLYEAMLKIRPLGSAPWKSICADCAGGIDSLVELLQGKLSKGVMERICRQHNGLFPSPAEIDLSCSCPDGAYMCKHLAAVLYGIGARFDHQPELLFRLRGVDEKDLILNAGTAANPMTAKGPAKGKVLVGDESLGDIFGLDMAAPDAANLPAATPTAPSRNLVWAAKRPKAAAPAAKKDVVKPPASTRVKKSKSPRPT